LNGPAPKPIWPTSAIDGVDLLAATSYSARGHSTTTLSAALQQLDLVRMQIVRYHQALHSIIDRDRDRG
jgi:hypothetical protein